MSRTIYPDLKLFKKFVNEQFLVCLREIFKKHPVYTYDIDQSNTPIHIEATYVQRNFSGKNPVILSRVGQYELDLQDMLGKNLHQHVMNDKGVYSGFSSMKDMTAAITVQVRAYSEEQSSDIADEIAMLVIYAANYMFSQVGLNIKRSAVSETSMLDNSNEIYETRVQFQGNVPWEFVKTDKEGALDGEFEFDYPDGWHTDYRPPGAYVIKGREKKD